MDSEIAQALQALTRMVDHVNEVRSLSRLPLNLSVILACSARRNGLLTEVEHGMIEQVINEVEAQVNAEPYENSRKLAAAIHRLWDESAGASK